MGDSTSELQKNLVGGFNPSEKYEFVNRKDYPIMMKSKIHVPNHPVFMDDESSPKNLAIYMAYFSISIHGNMEIFRRIP